METAPFKKFFEPTEKVTPNHILWEQFKDNHPKIAGPYKFIFYMVLTEAFGHTEVDTINGKNGSAGYRLKVSDLTKE